jgi:hypothetical protein
VLGPAWRKERDDQGAWVVLHTCKICRN